MFGRIRLNTLRFTVSVSHLSKHMKSFELCQPPAAEGSVKFCLGFSAIHLPILNANCMMSLFSRRIPLTVLALAISVVAVYSPTLVQRRANVQGFKLPISRTPRLGHGRFSGQTLSTDVSVTNSQEL